MPFPGPLAVVTFAFDPYLHLGDRAIRLEAIGVAAAIFAGLAGAAIALWGLRRVEAATETSSDERAILRFDDLLLLALAAVPGAIVGGRAGYALLHLDYYEANPAAVLDPGNGSLELGLAVVGGTLTAALLARILDRGLGSWLHIAAVPLLGALALGKSAAALGGTGQGAFTNGSIATAYMGTGPWGSLGADMPAWPSQLLESVLVLVAAVAIAGVGWRWRRRPADGRLFFLALGVWAVLRFAVAFTWRDAEVAGPLRADQLISLGIGGTAVLAYVGVGLTTRRSAEARGLSGDVPLTSSRWPLEDR